MYLRRTAHGRQGSGSTTPVGDKAVVWNSANVSTVVLLRKSIILADHRISSSKHPFGALDCRLSFHRLSKMELSGLRWPMAPILTILCLLLTSLVRAADANDASILINEIGRSLNQSLLWGPYRPNLYFGVRPRIPKSLMGGLMWAKVDSYQDVQHSKFICDWITSKPGVWEPDWGALY